MVDVDPAALGARAEAMIKALAPISAEPNRLVRLFLSSEHRRAADLTAQWMREAGLTVTEDALGTLRGRIGEGPRLLIGSHLNSVVDGGNYDGPLGVIAGILALAHFGSKPPLPVDVLAFGDALKAYGKTPADIRRRYRRRRWACAPHAVRCRPRQADDGEALSRVDDVRALPRRH